MFPRGRTLRKAARASPNTSQVRHGRWDATSVRLLETMVIGARLLQRYGSVLRGNRADRKSKVALLLPNVVNIHS